MCPSCEGRALLVATLRRAAGERILAAASTTPTDDALPCPSCRAPMSASRIRAGEDHVELDVCSPCALVWFDGGEHDIVQNPFPRPPSHPPIPMRATKRSLQQLEMGSVGEARAPRRRRFMTWSTIALILLVSGTALVFGQDWLHKGALEEDSTFPLDRGRTAWEALRLFVNPNPLFLALHVGALAIVGPIVEERLERGRFAVLLLMSGLGAVIASAIPGQAANPYALGSAPFVAASFATALVLHPRMHLRIWPAQHTSLPLWAVALVWALLSTAGILAEALPPIWPALFVAACVGGGAGAFTLWTDDD